MTPSVPDYGLLDRMGAASSIFFPRPDFTLAPEGATDCRIEVDQGVSLSARLYTVGLPQPTILYFHGNGEVVGDHDDISAFYRQIGVNLFVVDFRGYGRSDGSPSFATLVADGPPAAGGFHRLLDELGFTGKRYIMGRSLGAHPALEIAANAPDRFAGVIIESGAGSMRRLAGRAGVAADEALALVAAHEAKVRSIAMPALVIHGERDELIPLASAAETYDTLGSTEKRFVVLQGAGHNDLLWLRAKEYFEAIAAFVA